MREIFKYEKGYWYPHLSPAEKELWERFIDANPNDYDTCMYDLHLGDGPAFDTLMDDGEDRNQDMLYRLRADVVTKKGERTDVIEIKKRAGLTAIAQVEKYTALLLRDKEISGNVRMVIITDIERPNMYFLCKETGIRLIVLGV